VEFAPHDRGDGDREGRSDSQLEALFVRVLPWDQPPLAKVGVDPRSAYVEQFWLPLLGPSATWFVRRLREGLDRAPTGFVLDLDETARSLGLGGAGGRYSPFRRALARCVRYEMVKRLDAETLAVRRTVSLLSEHLVTRLPTALRVRHSAIALPPIAATANPKGRLAALSLVAAGEPPDAAVARLAASGFSGAQSAEAVEWAQARLQEAHALLAEGTAAPNPG